MTTTVPPQTGFSPQRAYRIVSVAEMITWALLIIGMVGKYAFDFDALVFPFGLIHGTAFVAYAATALIVGLNQRWPFGRIVGAVAMAIVPFGTLPLDRSLERRGLLSGGWRTEASDDPRDGSAIDRALRWGLRNPVPFAILVVVIVVAIVSVLLVIGPPGEWGK
ncbi:MAG: DUF3817 domain-containing protein [Cumulibacter sp.]